MKPAKTILPVPLAFAGAAVAGVLIGVYTANGQSPVSPYGTNVTNTTSGAYGNSSGDAYGNSSGGAYSGAYGNPSSGSATNAIGAYPQPGPGEPPPPGQMRGLLTPHSPVARPMPPPIAIAPGHQTLPTALVARRLRPDERYIAARERMVQEQLIGRGFTDPAVLRAMQTVKRDNFVPAMQLSNAYVDMTMDCGSGRILETPFVIATTARQLATQPGDRILEVEAAPGYATAVYSLLVKEVYATQSIYADSVAVDLQIRGFTNNVFVRQADAAQGWPEAAPFDTIVFNGPLTQISENLLAQLKSGGRLIIPATGDGKLCVLKKYGTQLVIQTTLPVRPTPIPGNQVAMPAIPAIQVLPPQR